MDVGRILSGKKKSESGSAYNDRITKGLQKSLQAISDIGSYETKVVVLGNSGHLTTSQVKKLVTGYEVDQFPYDRCYSELLFPVVNGTFFSDPNLSIDIHLDNLKGGTTHLSYDARIGTTHANIKLLFVPTQEIGRIMSKYKNSILKFNPRSFLELESNKVNQAIEASIRSATKNEFSLFNNGITIVSQQTSFSTDTGKQGTAQVVILRPNLVNGAQTAFTLARIYDDCEKEKSFSVFNGKEVLLKVITLVDSPSTHQWLSLVGEISKASNSQTRVDDADRRSNDEIQLKLQSEFFSKYGLFYERKKGEFADGQRDGYLEPSDIVDRVRLVRIVLASELKLREARASISKFFEEDTLAELLKVKNVPRYVFGYAGFASIRAPPKGETKGQE